jgi:hypothetical protein
MKKAIYVITLVVIGIGAGFPQSAAQDKKLERIRIGGGAVGAPQMTMWFAKEANPLREARTRGRSNSYTGELFGVAGDALRRGADYSARRHGFNAS